MKSLVPNDQLWNKLTISKLEKSEMKGIHGGSCLVDIFGHCLWGYNNCFDDFPCNLNPGSSNTCKSLNPGWGPVVIC